jgi:3-mercaptopyruvate sulfurtransferase SseA
MAIRSRLGDLLSILAIGVMGLVIVYQYEPLKAAPPQQQAPSNVVENRAVAPNDIIDGQQLLQIQAAQNSVLILDMRDRNKFQAGHIRGSFSIPINETWVRMPHEVPQGAFVVIYCPSVPCAGQAHYSGENKRCTAAYLQLHHLGFQKVNLLKGTLANLKAMGIEIDSSQTTTFPHFDSDSK